MIYKITRAEVDSYFEDEEHLSHTKIKRILKGVDEYNKDKKEKELYYEEKGAIIIGNGVDTMLTEGQQEFNRQFHVANVEKPGGKTLSILQYLYDRTAENYEGQSMWTMTLTNSAEDEDIILACDSEGFQKNWKDPARINAIRKHADYFDDMCMAHGKQVVDAEDMELINEIVASLRTNDLTAKYFRDDSNLEQQLPGLHSDIYYQYPVYFEIENRMCKVLYDIVYVDHALKTIEMIDLKTTGVHTINFPYQAIRMRYDIQAAFYYNAFQFSELHDTLGAEYTIAPFKFMVESTTNVGTPIMYVASSEFITMGKHGRNETVSERMYTEDDGSIDIYHNPVHGYIYGMNLHMWHEENGFEKDRSIVEGNGVLQLGWGRSWV